jgi:hypothetical protein
MEENRPEFHRAFQKLLPNKEIQVHTNVICNYSIQDEQGDTVILTCISFMSPVATYLNMLFDCLDFIFY